MAVLTDHDLLLRIDERQITMMKDIASLKETDKLRKCPNVQCNEHSEILEVHETSLESLDKRLSKMEDHEKIVLGTIVIGIIGSGFLVWLLSYLTGK